MRIIRDKYLRERGGTAKIIKISCAKCGSELFIYQKDGPGWLKRCYLNRIISPKVNSHKEKLSCVCGEVIGSLIKHKDDRRAYHLIRGKFKRTPFKKPK